MEIALNSAETFPQDFYARKLGENTVFYAVLFSHSAYELKQKIKSVKASLDLFKRNIYKKFVPLSLVHTHYFKRESPD